MATHQSVINVLDAARRAGLARLTFAAQTGDGQAADAASRGRGRHASSRPWPASGGAPSRAPAPGRCGRCRCCYRAVTALRRVAYALGWLQDAARAGAGDRGRQPGRRRRRQDADRDRAGAGPARRPAGRRASISRGHGRQRRRGRGRARRQPAAEVGDEPLLLHLRTRAPVWVARRRVDAARGLCAAHPEVDVLVADDGLQHLALARDVQVIVFDERGVGNGWLLPAGPLRQPLPAARAGRTAMCSTTPRAPARPGRVRWRSAGWPARCCCRTGGAARRATLRGAAGAARPAAAGRRRHGRAAALLRHAARGRAAARPPCPCPTTTPSSTLPWPADTPDVLVTEKDAVKLPREPAGADAHLGGGARLPAARKTSATAVLRQPAPRVTAHEHRSPPARPAGLPGLQGPAATAPRQRRTASSNCTARPTGWRFPIRDGIPVMLETRGAQPGRRRASAAQPG